MKKLIMSLAFAFFGLTAVNAQTGTHDQEQPRHQEQRGGQQDDGMYDQDDEGLQDQQGQDQQKGQEQLRTDDGQEFDVAEKNRISIVELPEEVVNELQSEEYRDMQILEVFELQPQDEDQDEAYEIHLMHDDQRKVKYFDSEGNELSAGMQDQENGEFDTDDENGMGGGQNGGTQDDEGFGTQNQ